jgi:TRAP-type transport system periplasmic protein
VKRFLTTILMATILLSLVLSGCASPAPSPAAPAAPAASTLPPSATASSKPAPSSKPSTAAPAAQQTWNIRMAFGQAVTSGYNVAGWAPWAKEVERVTNGRVKVTPYPNQTLVKDTDTWEGIKSGIADVTYLNSAYFAGQFDLSDVSTLPYVMPSGEVGSKAIWNLVQKYPEIQAQFKDVKLLSIWSTEPYYFASNKKFFKTPEDIKGQKIRIASGPPTDMLKLLGGTPALFSMGEVYLNLQKGVINAVSAPSEGIVGFRLYEVAPYMTYVPTYSGSHMLLMNKETWNAFPADIQQAIMGVSGEGLSVKIGREVFDLARVDMTKQVAAAGYKINEYTVPPDEVAKWVELSGKPVWDSWVKKMAAKGSTSAGKILEDLNSLVKQYNK